MGALPQKLPFSDLLISNLTAKRYSSLKIIHLPSEQKTRNTTDETIKSCRAADFPAVI